MEGNSSKSIMYVQLVFRKRNASSDILEAFKKDITDFDLFETENRIIATALPDTVKGSFLLQLLRDYHSYLFVGLAYETTDFNEEVTDFRGNLLDSYKTALSGYPAIRYIGKQIRIVRKYSDMVYSVQCFYLDLNSLNVCRLCFDCFTDIENGGIDVLQYFSQGA